MKYLRFKNILVVGGGRLTAGIVTNLLQSEATVYFTSNNIQQDKQFINDNITDWKQNKDIQITVDRLLYIQSASEAIDIDLAVCITEENLVSKQQWIRKLERLLPSETIIATNTESFLLDQLQQQTKHPERIVGLNWCDPAHTTAFLEIIANEMTSPAVVKRVEIAARDYWHKDPYTVYCGYSVRSRLMAALIREAFYLVEHGYASVEDIDRSCRNDAGYYLPFAGNCRYMDLMGSYAYGLVMKDLNRELSKQDQPPSFFIQLINAGKTGMESKAGFYNYAKDEEKGWDEQFRKFSFEIKDIMEKYPFNYLREELQMVNSKITLNE